MLRKEKIAYCRCCGNKFTFRERCKRHIKGKIVCNKCGITNYVNRFIIY